MKSFAVLLLACFCGNLVPATEGLTCYKTKWDDVVNGVLEVSDNTPTEVCGEADGGTNGDASSQTKTTPINNIKNDEITTTTEKEKTSDSAGSNVGPDVNALKALKYFAKLSDTSYYCFAALITDDKNKTLVERGCKNDAKTDNCLDMLPPNTMLSSCNVCENDMCNSGVSVTILSAQYPLVLAAVFAKWFFQTK